jgi:hypothetical protein
MVQNSQRFCGLDSQSILLWGLQFRDQLGNAIERRLIQHPPCQGLKAHHLSIDLVALTAHETIPHSRELIH